jgi:hypothetical protein
MDNINVDFVKHDGVQRTVAACQNTLLTHVETQVLTPSRSNTHSLLSNPAAVIAVATKVQAFASKPGAIRDKSSRSSFVQQFWTLCRRNTFNFALNPGVYWLRVAMYAALCLCLGNHPITYPSPFIDFE